MIRSLFTGASGMIAQQLNLDVIANNLANVNTTGYKKSKADFQDLMYQQVQEPGVADGQTGNSPTGIQVGLGVRPAAVGKIYSQGDFESTSNPFDVAIEGDGFFEITQPNGETAYTRSGAFKVDANGSLVTSDGHQLNPGFTVPPDAVGVIIAEDGIVSVRQPGVAAPSQIGQFQIARFQNPAGLRSRGNNLLEETESSGPATLTTPGEDGAGSLAQGFLESSNVSVVEEIVSMVTGQRAYEANSKSVTTADSILNTAINLKR